MHTMPADHTELKRERWTASVTYVFRENVKNNELAVNPLGLTIVRFRADQAFSKGIVGIPKGELMSTPAANPAASPSLSLWELQTANRCQTARESGENCLSSLGGQRRSNGSAMVPDFCSQSTDENFGPMCVCRYV